MVGVSGGPDSFVLLRFLEECRPQLGLTCGMTVAHVNYGLRGKDSDLDELAVTEYCLDRGLECKVLRVDEPAPPSGLQDWARRLRMDFFRSLMSTRSALFLGHQVDDVAEGVLLRLARGVSFGQLSGLPMVRGALMRPLLGASRSAIEACAARHHLPIRYDQSNDKTIYNRNRVRHEVLPVLEDMYPGAKTRLARLDGDLAELMAWFKELHFEVRLDRLQCNLISRFPRILGMELISNFIKKSRGQGVQLSYSVLCDIYQACSEPHRHRSFALPCGLLSVREGELTWTQKSASPRYDQHRSRLLASSWQGTLLPFAECAIAYPRMLILTSRAFRPLDVTVRKMNINDLKEMALGKNKQEWELWARSRGISTEACLCIEVGGWEPVIFSSEGVLYSLARRDKIVLEDYPVSIQNHLGL